MLIEVAMVLSDEVDRGSGLGPFWTGGQATTVNCFFFDGETSHISTKIITMIEWIRNSRLWIKNFRRRWARCSAMSLLFPF